MSDLHIFIPSYHRSDNLKSVRYLAEIGWEMSRVVVFIDNEAGDGADYEEQARTYGFSLEVLDFQEQIKRYDYVHRAPKSLRSVGQWQNAFCEYAEKNRIGFYCYMDDDTSGFEIKLQGRYQKVEVRKGLLSYVFGEVVSMMEERGLGAFALPQTGDFIGGETKRLWMPKMMNCIIYQTGFVRRGMRGCLDVDTSQFTGIWNEGLFCGSLADGVTLKQTPSGVSGGGLTALYHEQRLVVKSLVVPIQFPSAVYAERQEKNGGRLHHHIDYRFLAPKILKGGQDKDNLNWRKWEEDRIFTNEKINQRYDYGGEKT